MTPDFLGCYDALADSYLDGVTWEPRRQLEARAAALLPALFLAASTASRRSSTSPRRPTRSGCGGWRVRFWWRRSETLAPIREAWAVELGL